MNKTSDHTMGLDNEPFPPYHTLSLPFHPSLSFLSYPFLFPSPQPAAALVQTSMMQQRVEAERSTTYEPQQMEPQQMVNAFPTLFYVGVGSVFRAGGLTATVKLGVYLFSPPFTHVY